MWNNDYSIEQFHFGFIFKPRYKLKKKQNRKNAIIVEANTLFLKPLKYAIFYIKFSSSQLGNSNHKTNPNARKQCLIFQTES